MKENDKFDVVLAKNIIARELKSLYAELGSNPSEQVLCCFDDIEKVVSEQNQPTGRDILTSKCDI